MIYSIEAEAYYLKPANASRRRIMMLVGIAIDMETGRQTAIVRERGEKNCTHIVSPFVFNLWRDNATTQSAKRH